MPQNPTLILNTKQHDKTLNLDALVIPPVANRHVTFPGDLFHGVPDTVRSSISLFVKSNFLREHNAHTPPFVDTKR